MTRGPVAAYWRWWSESLPPLAWKQYGLFTRGAIVPPPILWTEPELSSAGFTPDRVVAFSRDAASETVLAAQMVALDVLYPPSTRPGRVTVRTVHLLVFESRNPTLLPLLHAVAKVQELKQSGAGSAAKER